MKFRGTNDKWRFSKEHQEITTSRVGIVEGSKCVASLGTFGKTDEEIEANGRLIESAPDLLKALAQIQFAVKSGAVKGLFQDEINDMDNAIEKALNTGKNGMD